jgi:Ca2+ regulator and membrane fusion protein Fig1
VNLMPSADPTSALVLGGCTSALPNVYVLSLSYGNASAKGSIQDGSNMTQVVQNLVNGTKLEVRVGHFGMCIKQTGSWFCSTKAASLTARLTAESGRDPLNLIRFASDFRHDIAFDVLMCLPPFRWKNLRLTVRFSFIAIALAVMCFILLDTLPGWHPSPEEDYDPDKEIKPFPSRTLSYLSLACATVSTGLFLGSNLRQHITSAAAASAAENMGHGTIRSVVGVNVIILGWVGFSMMVIPMIGLVVMILSMQVISRLGR